MQKQTKETKSQQTSLPLRGTQIARRSSRQTHRFFLQAAYLTYQFSTPNLPKASHTTQPSSLLLQLNSLFKLLRLSMQKLYLDVFKDIQLSICLCCWSELWVNSLSGHTCLTEEGRNVWILGQVLLYTIYDVYTQVFKAFQSQKLTQSCLFQLRLFWPRPLQSLNVPLSSEANRAIRFFPRLPVFAWDAELGNSSFSPPLPSTEQVPRQSLVTGFSQRQT